MSLLNAKQALKAASDIYTRFGDRIETACQGSIVDPAFVAGLICNEAGRRRGVIVESATRFEPAVYADLVWLRDNGYCFIGKARRTTYSGVTRAQIADASDAALRALATSYGLLQIMGWHSLASLDCTIADLRDPAKHLGYAVKLLGIVGKPYLTKARSTRSATVRDEEFEKVCRIWNTGRPNGKTYHASYVPNARAVRISYAAIAAAQASTSPDDRPIVPQPAQPVAAVAPASNTTTTTTLSTETTIGDVERPAVEVQAPEPTGFLAKLKAFIASLIGGTTLLAFLERFGTVSLSTSILIVILFVVFLAFTGFVVWYIVDSWKSAQRVKIEADINTNPDRNDITFKQW